MQVISMSQTLRLQAALKEHFNCKEGVAVTQVADQVVYQSEGRWLNPSLLRSTCHSILEQDTEPRFAPRCIHIHHIAPNGH